MAWQRLAVINAFLALVAAEAPAFAQTKPAKGSVTVPLVGFRQLDPEFFVEYSSADKKTQVRGIPKSLFLEAISDSAAARAALEKAGKSIADATVDDWFHAAQSLAMSNQWQQEIGRRPFEVGVFKSPRSGKWVSADRQLLIGLTGSEFFGVGADNKLSLSTVTMDGRSIEIIHLDPAASSVFKYGYEKITAEQVGGSWHSSLAVMHCAAGLHARPSAARYAKFTQGEVSFGSPLLRLVAKTDFDVPPTVAKNHRMYWLDLFATVRNVPETDLIHLTFNVELLPTSTMSLVLLPQVEQKVTVQQVPGLSLNLKILDGPPYMNLKPTIVSGGLRENKLFWTMRASAISQGVFTLTAAIQIPAGIEFIEVAHTAVAQTRPRLFAHGYTIATEETASFKVTLDGVKQPK